MSHPSLPAGKQLDFDLGNVVSWFGLGLEVLGSGMKRMHNLLCDTAVSLSACERPGIVVLCGCTLVEEHRTNLVILGRDQALNVLCSDDHKSRAVWIGFYLEPAGSP